jgi:branched-chain amino acid aminotransferase
MTETGCINYNGKIIPAGGGVLHSDDRGYRYGDGLFETMRIINGRIVLEEYHFDRLFAGMNTLEFSIPAGITATKLKQEILQLCGKNNCSASAKVRLSVSRGSGGLNEFDGHLNYIIEAVPLQLAGNPITGRGIVIDVYPGARKSCDTFANLKSANYLPYVMAALYAKKNNLDDCLVQNQHGRICDASIANIFWIKDGKFFTPPLSEGCVAGVMRRWILECGSRAASPDLHPEENILTEEILLEADEVFLTNAINGIRPVRQFRNKIYTSGKTVEIYNRFVQTIFS